MRALYRRFREEYPVVGQDAHRQTVNMSGRADEGLAILGFELVEPARIHDAKDDFPVIERLFEIGPDNPPASKLAVRNSLIVKMKRCAVVRANFTTATT